MDSARWACVVARSPRCDDAFVYAVKTTKIYCRPTCSARLARRANVEFYNTSLAAEAAGYRSCKRCRPELVTYSPQNAKVSKACDTICRYSLGPTNPPLRVLAAEAGLTKYHFHRLFKKKTGLTPKQFTEALRSGGGDESSTGNTTPPVLDADKHALGSGSTSRSPVCFEGVNLAYSEADLGLLDADLEFLSVLGPVDVFEAEA